MDDELEMENPVCAPDAKSYSDTADQGQDQDQDKVMEAMPTAEVLLDSF